MIEDEKKEEDEKDEKEEKNKRPDLSKLERSCCDWECSADGGTC